MEDKELLVDFVIEARDHLSDIENQFLAIEQNGSNVDVALVNEVFRAIHSIKGAAGFLGLTNVNDLAHNLENLLNMMRNGELVPTSPTVDIMLRAADTLRNMILDVENSNDVDISKHVLALTQAAEAAITSISTNGAPHSHGTVDDETSVIDPLDAEIEAAFERARSKSQNSDENATAPVSPGATAENAAASPMNIEAKSGNSAPGDTSIRVSVGVLDSLMNLAGELVLSRNQLMQVISSTENAGLEAISARLDQVTSELQEAIMKTRMQPIGSVFSRFPRVVRDLSSKLGKQCELIIDGKEVEVDKTIIEAIGDPLTHLVRNSIDHGIEMPSVRTAKGKSTAGTLYLRACYQAGKVRIEIKDDGAGIDPAVLREKAVAKGILTADRAEQMSDREAVRLIFAPGFSTAKEVTDVSGRGVGMDVVLTNVAKLGGTVDVESVHGEGTNIVVTLPLTLAIIPSLIVQVGADRFAIPQVNIAELVRIREDERSTRLGRVNDAEVLRLRGSLLPLVRLRESLKVDRGGDDTAMADSSATNIIVVDTGRTRFGLVVDALHDSEEIVVKPLGRHHNECRCLAGATILGDGHVALILDVTGIALQEELRPDDESALNNDDMQQSEVDATDRQSVFLFQTNPNDHFAIPMDLVARIERVRTDQIDSIGGSDVLQYRTSTLPLVHIDQHVKCRTTESYESVYIVVFHVQNREVGLVAPVLNDIRSVPTNVDTVTFREPGIIGSLVIDGVTTRLVELFELTELAHPDWFVDREEPACTENGSPPYILLAEDSAFFRNQVLSIFEQNGYLVEACEDGLEAWEALQSGEFEFDVIVTDIEMPNLNGFELCRRVKDSPALKHLPVIALTSLAGTADVQHGIEVGIDDYQIKMDRDKLLNSLKNFVDHGKPKSAQGKKTAVKRESAQLVGSH